MIGATIEFGPNMLVVLLAVVNLLQLVVNGHRTKATQQTAEAVVAELNPNGGGSAFDKLTAQIDGVRVELVDRLDKVEGRVAVVEQLAKLDGSGDQLDGG